MSRPVSLPIAVRDNDMRKRRMANNHQFFLPNTSTPFCFPDTAWSLNLTLQYPDQSPEFPLCFPWIDHGQIPFPKPDMSKPVATTKLLSHRDSWEHFGPSVPLPHQPLLPKWLCHCSQDSFDMTPLSTYFSWEFFTPFPHFSQVLQNLSQIPEVCKVCLNSSSLKGSLSEILTVIVFAMARFATL